VGEVGTGRAVPHWAALDGLRAMAVAIVLACHFGLDAPGGVVGVDLFFVISGFLITSLLLSERDRNGGIGLKNFWSRRALRLLPALGCAIALALIVSLAATPQMRRETFDGLPLVLFYGGNWARAFGPADALGLLGHTWSLAVEEQFYLVWPLVCVAWLCRTTHRRRAAITVATLAIVDCAYLVFAMAHWGQPQGYFRTDTHALGLLGGAALALYVSTRSPQATLGERPRWILQKTAAFAVFLIVFVTILQPQSPAEQGWIIIIASAASLALVARFVLAPGGPLNRAFASAPARWFGRRSYGIYLYHYPFAIAVVQAHHWHGWGLLLIDIPCIGGSVALAAASYRWVELPFLRRKQRYTTTAPAPVSLIGASPA
jgi:peptidoglycan/LPS O-acetylase OafA/YrhL